jgi:tetratricopeptide (TPR) repeat protein
VALGQGRLDEALSEFEREAAINPMSGPVYDRLGDTYLQKNQLEKAQEALNQALLLEPDATGPYILLGQVLLKQDNPTTAAAYLKRAVEMDPGNEYGHYFLGQAYRDLGRKQDAMLEFQASAKLKASSARH